MGFVFGEVDATHKPDLSFPPKRRQVLLHDHAGTGFPSWVPLMDGVTPRGICSFDGNALVLTTGDENYGGTNAQFYSSLAASRLTRPAGFSKLYVEWEWAARVYSYYAGGAMWSGVKSWHFGIDTCGSASGAQPAAGQRSLAFLECMNYDESGAKLHSGKWRIATGDATAPGATDITDKDGKVASPVTPGYEGLTVGLNYGKLVRQYSEMVFDLSGGGVSGATTAVLEGLRHNGVGFGSLADGGNGYDPDIGTNARANELKTTALIPARTTDGQFQNGLNLMVQIENRSTQPFHNTLFIYRVRAVAF